MNYFELFIGDYLKKTKQLSLTEHGAFFQLMLAYYGDEHPLPEPYDPLYNICSAKTPLERRAVRNVADRYFPVSSDGLRHSERADEVILAYLSKVETARENGKKGGRPHKNLNKTKRVISGLALGSSTETETITQTITQTEAPHTPVPNPQLEQTQRKPNSVEEVRDWWRIYRPDDPISNATTFWNKGRSRGWVDGNGIPIQNWQAYAAIWNPNGRKK